MQIFSHLRVMLPCVRLMGPDCVRHEVPASSSDFVLIATSDNDQGQGFDLGETGSNEGGARNSRLRERLLVGPSSLSRLTSM